MEVYFLFIMVFVNPVLNIFIINVRFFVNPIFYTIFKVFSF